MQYIATVCFSGSLSGVQSSIQSALDLLKFCLVVALPHPRFFGILVLLSFTVMIVMIMMIMMMTMIMMMSLMVCARNTYGTNTYRYCR